MNGLYNLLWCEMKLMGFRPTSPRRDCPAQISQLQLAAATRKEAGGGNNERGTSIIQELKKAQSENETNFL